jgi:hypothetical protein
VSNPSPPASGQFSSEENAWEHLCDHVLTRPEAHDWALILPNYATLVSPTNDAALTAVAASLFSSLPSAEGVELRKGYLEALRQAIDDALRLGWWWEQRQGKYQEWLGLGLDGIHVIWDAQVIKTGFFLSSVRSPPSNPPPRTENPLPRRNPKDNRPAPRDGPRRHYQLFCDNHYCVSKKYVKAYDAITAAGGDVFVDPLKPPLKRGKWQQLLAEHRARNRPSEEPS